VPYPHWQAFAEGLARLAPEEMARRWDLGQRLLRDNGVTYNVYGDPAGLDRPWQLDPVPLILSAQEWDGIARAVRQRAALMEGVLSDLYGPRNLIHWGQVPEALLHANPNFLRPCHGWQPKGRRRLLHYAADLARGADGQWRVVGDRTESPAGAGYALENRSIVSRVLPEFHRSLHVRRLGTFFEEMRRTLQAMSPRRIDDPRIVLLTPGPYNATYFEHAYLARQLGVTLVQGEDLTVRDNNVYLKALTGLQRVDVVYRRTGGVWCDPLELRGDSALGVAGLLQSARSGNVAIANSLGTGLLDGALIMGFMPSIAQALDGGGLLMESVPTWWCGTPENRAHVLANLERLVLRPAFASRELPKAGASLSETGLASLRRAIETQPWNWVAQELGGTSTAPVWVEGRLEPHYALLRVFAIAGKDGWDVMPGGLARVAAQPELLACGLQNGGGGSKDVWVLSDERRDGAGQARSLAPAVTLTRDNRDLPSRVADNMFWLGRYVERCESRVRLLRCALGRMQHALDQGDPETALSVLKVMGQLGLSLPAGIGDFEPTGLPLALAHHHLGGSPGTLSDAVGSMLRVVGLLRDRLSVDTWRALHRLRDEIAGLGDEADESAVIGRLHGVVLTMEAVSGLAMENMTRGPQWLFMDSGRRIERAIAVVETVAGALAGADGEGSLPLDVLLEVWDSVMTYRSRYMASPRLAGVLDLLLCDESNPRSLGFQLAALSHHMDSLAQMAGSSGFYRPEQKQMTVLCGTVRTADVVQLARFDKDGGFNDADRLMDLLRSRLWQLSEEISRTYFSHARWRLPVTTPEILP
jgi:uncharacterized circularly permuted ATP-grasp superfamily protein/uncharacterized alpha-E superfamily protein